MGLSAAVNIIVRKIVIMVINICSGTIFITIEKDVIDTIVHHLCNRKGVKWRALKVSTAKVKTSELPKIRTGTRNKNNRRACVG
jgi:hypothetical protein